MLKEVEVLRISDGDRRQDLDTIVEEMPLALYINGRHVQTAMISPSMIREFVIGHLFSERVVKDYDEIESIQIDENIAKVLIKRSFGVINLKKVVLSGCGGGSSFLDESRIPKIDRGFKIDPEQLLRSMKKVLSLDLHKKTGGSHSVGLFDKNGAIVITEDIGRHNALDKVIGHGVIENINFKDTFVASSGRISSDMILKCISVGIPAIASKSAVTNLAIEIGKTSGATIIGFVRGGGMVVYTGSLMQADE